MYLTDVHYEMLTIMGEQKNRHQCPSEKNNLGWMSYLLVSLKESPEKTIVMLMYLLNSCFKLRAIPKCF